MTDALARTVPGFSATEAGRALLAAARDRPPATPPLDLATGERGPLGLDRAEVRRRAGKMTRRRRYLRAGLLTLGPHPIDGELKAAFDAYTKRYDVSQRAILETLLRELLIDGGAESA